MTALFIRFAGVIVVVVIEAFIEPGLGRGSPVESIIGSSEHVLTDAVVGQSSSLDKER